MLGYWRGESSRGFVTSKVWGFFSLSVDQCLTLADVLKEALEFSQPVYAL